MSWSVELISIIRGCFSLFNSIKTTNQTSLLIQLPTLYIDLLTTKNVDTLNKFIALIHGMSTSTLSNDISKKFIDKMCVCAAVAVTELQC